MTNSELDTDRYDAQGQRRDEIDRLVSQLRDMPLADEGRVTAEERNLFFELLGISPPSNDINIPPPTADDLAQLRMWLENRDALSDDERIRLFGNYHQSAVWRSAVDELTCARNLPLVQRPQ